MTEGFEIWAVRLLVTGAGAPSRLFGWVGQLTCCAVLLVTGANVQPLVWLGWTAHSPSTQRRRGLKPIGNAQLFYTRLIRSTIPVAKPNLRLCRDRSGRLGLEGWPSQIYRLLSICYELGQATVLGPSSILGRAQPGLKGN